MFELTIQDRLCRLFGSYNIQNLLKVSYPKFAIYIVYISPLSPMSTGYKKKPENKCGYNNKKKGKNYHITLFLSQMQTNAPWTDGGRRQTWASGQLEPDHLTSRRSNFPRWLRFVKRNDENANDIRTHATCTNNKSTRLGNTLPLNFRHFQLSFQYG